MRRGSGVSEEKKERQSGRGSLSTERRHVSEKFDCDHLTSKILSKSGKRSLPNVTSTNKAGSDERSNFLKRMERFHENQQRRPSISLPL